VALRTKFEHFPASDEPHRRFKQFLYTATQSFENDAAPSLTDVL
jgi:hypothetical protein